MVRLTRRLGAVLVLGLALTACQKDPSTTAEFLGPSNSALVIGYSETCAPVQGDVQSAARNSTITVDASKFLPEETVTLHWFVDARQLEGSWESVVTNADGKFQTDLDLPKSELEVGDLVEIWAQGPGKDGIMAVTGKVPIGSC
ncbi:MAG TPA: hypothetical protein VMT88_02965 [Actinomycetes bacterium]|nr:hypothetical protein [Actinomycetes bacterium]